MGLLAVLAMTSAYMRRMCETLKSEEFPVRYTCAFELLTEVLRRTTLPYGYMVFTPGRATVLSCKAAITSMLPMCDRGCCHDLPAHVTACLQCVRPVQSEVLIDRRSQRSHEIFEARLGYRKVA
jgi:hypothetical protein